MGSITPFIGEPLDFEIRDEIMHCSKSDWAIAIPLRTFRTNMRRAQKAIDEYEARKAEVVPMRRPPRKR